MTHEERDAVERAIGRRLSPMEIMFFDARGHFPPSVTRADFEDDPRVDDESSATNGDDDDPFREERLSEWDDD